MNDLDMEYTATTKPLPPAIPFRGNSPTGRQRGQPHIRPEQGRPHRDRLAGRGGAG